MELLGYKRVQQRRSWQQQWEQQDSKERELDSFKKRGERFDQLWRKTDEAIDQLMSSMEKFRRALEQRDKSVSFDTMEANFEDEDPNSSELVHREIESMELEKKTFQGLEEDNMPSTRVSMAAKVISSSTVWD
ncbi:hypothetical protein FH972_007662 [Carpinus fangiana]|uniref:Uncharacterized protein n=1 Tax=Carpinus fangiana TaxID=176857 RepID=A0A5N6QZB3_9ROSI|nr:hypothetical protein FH972_007662 [Carpinus fangiana]